MAFKDLFLPKLLHSNPEKRKEAVRKEKKIDFLERVVAMDKDPEVVGLAKQRIGELQPDSAKVQETD